MNAGFSAFIRQAKERGLLCRRVMENQLGFFCKYSLMPISWKIISEQLRGLIVSAFLFASVRPNSVPAWMGCVVLADFSNTGAWPKAFSWGVVMGHWQPHGHCGQRVSINAGFLQQCPGKLQGRSTACSCPGGRGNPSQLQLYSPSSNTQTHRFALLHMENLNVFNFTDCFLNLIRFYSWNEIMRQLWKALGVRNRAGLLAECCCAPLRACSLPQAAPRPPSSEEVETLLQLQHCLKLSPPHSSWPSSLARFQSIFIPCCFRACVCWCCGMWAAASQERHLPQEKRDCSGWCSQAAVAHIKKDHALLLSQNRNEEKCWFSIKLSPRC